MREEIFYSHLAPWSLEWSKQKFDNDGIHEFVLLRYDGNGMLFEIRELIYTFEDFFKFMDVLHE